MYKIAVYVPETHLESIKNAMFSAGAGAFGRYDCCSWQTLGIGQFRPLEGANPTCGNIGEVMHVAEYKVEMVVPENKLAEVVAAYKDAHPYEVPAYEVYQTVDVEDY